MTQKKFTLVELLLVMAVIMLLAALLFPALSTVRSTAKRIKCVANLRQFGLGFNMYAMENHGYIFSYLHYVPGDCIWWPNKYGPYMKMQSSQYRKLDLY